MKSLSLGSIVVEQNMEAVGVLASLAVPRRDAEASGLEMLF